MAPGVIKKVIPLASGSILFEIPGGKELGSYSNAMVGEGSK